MTIREIGNCGQICNELVQQKLTVLEPVMDNRIKEHHMCPEFWELRQVWIELLMGEK